MITKINEFYNFKINESSFDSSWIAEDSLSIIFNNKSTVDVDLKFIAFYNSPSYIELEVCITPKSLIKLGYTNYNIDDDDDLIIWSKSKENSKINTRTMNDIDVYNMFSKVLPKQFKLTQNELESLILKATSETEKAIRKTSKKK